MKDKLKYGMIAMATAAAISCVDTSSLETRMDSLEAKIASMEQAVGALNSNIVALNRLYDTELLIVGKTEKTDDKGTVTGYILEFSDGTKAEVTFGADYEAGLPVVRVTDGYWEVSYDGGENFERLGKVSEEGLTPAFRIDSEGYWTVSFGSSGYERITDEYGRPISAVNGSTVSSKPIFEDVVFDSGKGMMIFTLTGGEVIESAVIETFIVDIRVGDQNRICLNETKEFHAELSDVADVIITAPQGWTATLEGSTFTVTGPSSGTEGEYGIEIYAVSTKGYIRKVTVMFTLNPVELDAAMTPAWNNFVAGNDENVLLDYSYAGYNHGETAPAESYGYKVYDVTDYGAVPNDGKSDREAFLKAVEAAVGKAPEIKGGNIAFPSVEKANAIVYFPAGEFILHNAEDDVDGVSQCIVIRSGNFILKGAGMDRTRILMDAPNQPTDPNVMYSSPEMILLAHWSGLSSFTVPATVTMPAGKGSFEATVASTSGIAPGDWVCLYVKNKDTDYVDAELAPYSSQKKESWSIVKDGVEVIDYHQVKSVDGNTVTFVEPIMHEVDPEREWEIKKYPHYSEVGVEDLTFAGKAKDRFGHHASWEDDGAYKPISMNRLTNSWIRRVRFESTSEACSITNSANVSAYSIEFTGNRGHAAVRSAASSRVFIGATEDHTAGYLVNNSTGVLETYCDNAGNYHAVGVSKQAMGTVLWRNAWGEDSCFESHATQPRATLIDCCSGGWMRWRQGGDADQVPNHLNDLTVWNFYATNANLSGTDGLTDINENFIWWDSNSLWWKILPPVIVGFHGPAGTHFNEEQVKLNESEGSPVWPESLYEAQLKKRLGSVPGWLQALK